MLLYYLNFPPNFYYSFSRHIPAFNSISLWSGRGCEFKLPQKWAENVGIEYNCGTDEMFAVVNCNYMQTLPQSLIDWCFVELIKMVEIKVGISNFAFEYFVLNYINSGTVHLFTHRNQLIKVQGSSDNQGNPKVLQDLKFDCNILWT